MVKRTPTISIAATVLLVAGLAGPAFGQQTKIQNTPHNLNLLGVWGIEIPQNRICLPCHVPHNAYPEADADVKMVLWNHDETDADFDMYLTLAEHQGVLNGPSKLCLSCHDGVTAIDSYGGATGLIKIPGWRPTHIGTDLTDDHPIGIAYPDGEPGYQPASGLEGVKLVDVGGTDRVECNSCHDPHNNGLGKFLRVPISGSEICLRCHDK